MKRMLSATSLLLILSFGSLAAQSKLTEEQKTEAKARHLAYRQQLNLSEQQATQVETINRTYFEGLSGLKTSRESRFSKLRTYKELSSHRDKQMKQVLSREQYALYQQYQKEVKEEFRNNRRSY